MYYFHFYCSRNLRVSPFNGVYPMLSPDDGAVACSPVSDNTYNYLINRTMNVNLLYQAIQNFQQPSCYIPTPFDHLHPITNYLHCTDIFTILLYLFFSSFFSHILNQNVICRNHFFFNSKIEIKIFLSNHYFTIT